MRRENGYVWDCNIWDGRAHWTGVGTEHVELTRVLEHRIDVTAQVEDSQTPICLISRVELWPPSMVQIRVYYVDVLLCSYYQ